MKDPATEAVASVVLGLNLVLPISGGKITVDMAVEDEVVPEATWAIVVVTTVTKATEAEEDKAAEAIGGKLVGDLVMLWEAVENFW